MNIKIFKTYPRLIFAINNKVYKYFSTSEECKNEIHLIKSSPMKLNFDKESDYTMSLVEIISNEDFFYVMDYVKGKKLDAIKSKNYYHLAGRWLKIFHDCSRTNHINDFFLCGDFVPEHLYIDELNKKITLIDPGMSFGKKGNIEEDLSRFIVQLFQSKNFNMTLLKKKIVNFIYGYGPQNINYEILKISVEYRINRNIQKFKLIDKNKFLNIFLSKFWNFIIILKYYFVKKYLKKNFYGI